jgi:release factor glutamine methyltransferase
VLTLKALLEEATETVGRTDAHVITAHVLGVNRAYLAAHPMRFVTEGEDARINGAIALRALGQPVAYILEKREFYGRDFIVGPDVLIPRPETEVLVEAALERAPTSDGSNRRFPATQPPAILDLGTGSGAIAITLACERPEARIAATDSSTAALRLAARNASANACNVELVEGDWYGAVRGRRFSMIVSNPPYIAATDPHLSQGDLRFEPRAALTDGSADGLDSIRTLVGGASEHLEAGGWLLFEHGYDQAEACRSLLEAAGFAELVSIPDLAGIPRVAGGKIR